MDNVTRGKFRLRSPVSIQAAANKKKQFEERKAFLLREENLKGLKEGRVPPGFEIGFKDSRILKDAKPKGYAMQTNSLVSGLSAAMAVEGATQNHAASVVAGAVASTGPTVAVAAEVLAKKLSKEGRLGRAVLRAAGNHKKVDNLARKLRK